MITGEQLVYALVFYAKTPADILLAFEGILARTRSAGLSSSNSDLLLSIADLVYASAEMQSCDSDLIEPSTRYNALSKKFHSQKLRLLARMGDLPARQIWLP